ncbi:SNF2 family N-terminal domain-containing protein [Pisolithus albus]|nr:SNF2 family N-terminal domain-containing protein [Pisolithus albus]KAI5983512.1 SNF2 family N-terminal domain-containing protein [Pisolithus albus]
MSTEQTVHLAGSTDHEEVFSLPRTPSRLRSAADFRSTCPADTLTRLLDTDEGGSLTEDTQGVTVNGLRHTVVLWDHQKVGVVWMRQREQGTKRGGIVADEMGLGKTILGIARILDGRPTSLDRAQGWSRATLVVCPVSLIGQWENEVEKFAIELNVVKHHGPSRSNNPLTLQDIHVVITSYATVASEYAAVCTNSGSRKSALFGVKWWRIILDEAHLIRNWQTKCAEACFNIVGKYRWCFTGTPIQNGVEDLYSMFRFMNVKPLGDLQAFKSHIIKPTKGGQATLAIERLQVVLRAVMLRRRKDSGQNDVLQLPGRRVHVVQCQFDEGERQLYHTLEGRLRSKVEDWVKQGLVKTRFACVLEMLLRLRQACDHLALVGSSSIVNEDVSSLSSSDSLGGLSRYIEDLNAELDDLLARLYLEADDESEAFRSTKPRKSFSHKSVSRIRNVPSPSAKMRQLAELLRKIDADSAGRAKTIVFSCFTSMLDLVQEFLSAEGFVLARYDGSMSTSERERNLECIRNNTEVKCILVSMKAGGTGLNLTACNNVILLEPWWNPAVEEQAFDRVHRIGQLLPVNIYKLVVANSVEERMLELQDKKRKLADATLSGTTSDTTLDTEDVRCLFRAAV